MLKSFVLAILLLALPAAGQAEDDPAPAPELDPAMLVQASVTRAIDGSSLDARVDGARTALGYVGVETPAPNQRCGREALERNSALAQDAVLLESDPAYTFDPNGRRLYYAYTLDGVSIDESLIREGLAHATRLDGLHGAQLAALEAEAQEARVGCLWSAA